MSTALRFQPRNRRAGFVLIWVLVLGVLLAALTSFALSSGRNRALSAQVSATDTRDNLLLNDALLYAQRLLAVHVSDLASAAARQQLALPGTSPGVQTSALQEQADQLFCHKLQQPGVTARIAFSGHACGQEISTPPASPTLSATGQGGNLVSAPYSVTVTTASGAQKVQQGLLRYVTGAVPVSAYALYQSGDATLAGDLSVTGPSYVLGEATLVGTFTTTSLAVSGCAVPGAGCYGQGGLRFGDGTFKTPMTLIPSAAHPCVASGCVTGTVNPAEAGDAPLPPTNTAVILPAFDHVLLGVSSTGEQRVTLCQGTSCTTYVQTGTNLTTDSGTLLSATFDGLYRTDGNVLIEPELVGNPSVISQVTVQASGEMTVNGDLRLANSPCPAGGDCTQDGNSPSDLLGLIAGGNITLNAGAIDAALLSGASVLGHAQESAGGTLVLGSVAAGARSSNLRVTHDPRLAAPSLTRPAGFPLLSASVHLVTLQDGQ